MTKIHVKRSTTYVIEDDDGKEYEVEHEPLEYFDPIIKKLASGKVVVGYLSDDPDPPNPRDDDNLGVMICWHRRYNLGDKHNYADPDDLTVEGAGEFPVDMLRYDAAFPHKEEDSYLIMERGKRKVSLLTQITPTQARWESFGWKVIATRKMGER